MPAKVLKIFFAQSLKMKAMRNFQKEVIFPSFFSFKIQKNFIWARRMRLWLPCPNIPVKILKTVCSNSGKDENFGRFPNKVVSPQNVRLTCTMKFWQIWRYFVAKKRKTFPNSKNVEVTIFWTKLFFHQKWFFSNGECNLDNGSKKFSLRVHTFAAQIPKTTKKNFEIFERKTTFLKTFLCTCRMQLWQPCQKFLVKTLKTFCSNSGKDEKLLRFPKKMFSPQNVPLNMHNEILASLP